jgi:hypothetical protein
MVATWAPDRRISEDHARDLGVPRSRPRQSRVATQGDHARDVDRFAKKKSPASP